jgi:hypothetical protein
MAHSLILAGEALHAAGAFSLRSSIHKAALVRGRSTPITNFLQALWEIRIPEEMLVIVELAD